MSTAIALQDISTVPSKDTSTVRHRTIYKSPTTDSEDPWLREPHDEGTTTLPLDSTSLQPTSTYWITPHGMLTKTITILDLTKDMTLPYTGMTSEYKDAVKKALKDHSFTPILSCKRLTWLGLKYDITSPRTSSNENKPQDETGDADAGGDSSDVHIAHWTHPWTSTGEATLTFPSSSPHSTHPISLRPKRWGLRTESFVLDSVPYIWEMDSLWHSTSMTLYRVVGSGESERKVEVAKYAQKWWGAFVTGGILVVDEREVDGAVVGLSCLVVLKKKRQRAAERRSGGD